MITLTTGVPGSGKTLYTIAQVLKKVEADNKALAECGKPPRNVYYSGIADLKLPWIELDDAKQWDDCETGAVIIIDECQRVFRPRGTGSQVPEYISALETHRHKGYDIFLITQHPMLVDQNIRRLVGQHWHVVRKFGLQRATIHEWGSTHEITQRNLLAAVRRQFAYSKEVFGYYKSAEMHTHKAKVPKRVFFLLLAPFLIAALAYYGYQKATSVGKKPEAVVANTATPSTGQAGSVPKQSKVEYFEAAAPRVEGLYHTAPKYDEITKPTDAPWPSACLISKSFDRAAGKYVDKCGCIDQQGNRYGATPSLCRQIAMNGIFKDWGQQIKSDGPAASEARRDADNRKLPEPEIPGVLINGSEQTPLPPGPAEHLYKG